MPEYNNSTRDSLTAKKTLVGKFESKKSMSGKLRTGYMGSSLNYNNLINKPSIESVELIGDKTFEELGLGEIDNLQIDNLFKLYFGV